MSIIYYYSRLDPSDVTEVDLSLPLFSTTVTLTGLLSNENIVLFFNSTIGGTVYMSNSFSLLTAEYLVIKPDQSDLISDTEAVVVWTAVAEASGYRITYTQDHSGLQKTIDVRFRRRLYIYIPVHCLLLFYRKLRI